jgi:hypothetical protein
MSINRTGLTTLLVDITSPADGARVEGNHVTVIGTASAHRESLTSPSLDPAGPLGPISEPSPTIKTSSTGDLPGDLPDELTFPSSSGDSSITDLTGQISQVRVSIHTGPEPGEFHTATPTGGSNQWATWSIQLPLPPTFRQATITAEVLLGGSKATTAIRVSQFRFAGELVTGD